MLRLDFHSQMIWAEASSFATQVTHLLDGPQRILDRTPWMPCHHRQAMNHLLGAARTK